MKYRSLTTKRFCHFGKVTLDFQTIDLSKIFNTLEAQIWKPLKLLYKPVWVGGVNATRQKHKGIGDPKEKKSTHMDRAQKILIIFIWLICMFMVTCMFMFMGTCMCVFINACLWCKFSSNYSLWHPLLSINDMQVGEIKWSVTPFFVYPYTDNSKTGTFHILPYKRWSSWNVGELLQSEIYSSPIHTFSQFSESQTTILLSMQ